MAQFDKDLYFMIEFLETSIFSRQIDELLTPSEYRAFQNLLIANPGVGKVIPGTGGLLKIRYKKRGLGKRGGIRVIYYWINNQNPNQVYLLFAYEKSKTGDISSKQAKQLKNMVEEYLHG